MDESSTENNKQPVKTPLTFYEYLPDPIKSELSLHKESIMSRIHEQTLLFFAAHNYDQIAVEICPIIMPMLKLYNAPVSEYAFYLEILAKSFFQPEGGLFPSAAYLMKDTLIALTRMRRIKGKFQLSWERALQTIELVFNEPIRSAVHLDSSVKTELQGDLPKIISKLRRYFKSDSGPKIYAYLKQFFGRPSNLSIRHIIYLTMLLRTDSHLKDEEYMGWMRDLIELWHTKFRFSASFSAATLILVAEIAKAHRDIDWEPYVDILVPNAIAWINATSFKHDEEDDISEGVKALKQNMIVSAFIYGPTLLSIMIRGDTKNLSETKIGKSLETTVLPFLKNVIQPNNPELNVLSKNVLNFVYDFFLCICFRGKYSDDDENGEKLKAKIKKQEILHNRELVHQLYDLFSEVFELLVNYQQEKLSELEFCYSLAFACPEKTFDHLVPKLISICQNTEVKHEFALSCLMHLITPLHLSTEYDKRYYYLNQILNCAINEINYASSEAGMEGLIILSDLLGYLPIPTKNYLKDVYLKENKKQTYEKYLNFLQNDPTQISKYYYHTLINSLEEQFSVILQKIFASLEIREKPAKSEIDAYAVTIHVFVTNTFPNISEPLLKKLFDQFVKFAFSGSHVNCIDEIRGFLCGFSRRIPNIVIPAVFDYVSKALIRKKGDTPSGKSSRLFMKFLGCEKINSIILNPVISAEQLEYCVNLILALLSESALDLTDKYKDLTETFITLLLVNEDNLKQKYAKKIFFSALYGCMRMMPYLQPFEKQDNNKFETAGKFNEKMLHPMWRFATPESLKFAKKLICLFGLDFGNFVLEEISQNSKGSANLLKKWLPFAANIIPGCAGHIPKEGGSELNLTSASYKNNPELAEFFGKTLRPKLYDLLTKLLLVLKKTDKLSKTSTKIAQKLMKCITCVTSLIKSDSMQGYGLAKFEYFGTDAKMKSPIKYEHGHRYNHYIQKTIGLYHQFSRYFEIRKELPSEPLRALVIETNQIFPYAVETADFFFESYFKAVSNIFGNDNAEIFAKEIIEQISGFAAKLISEMISSKYKNEQQEKLLIYYTNCMEQIMSNHDNISMDEKFILNTMIDKFLVPACKTDNETLFNFVFVVINWLQNIVSNPFKYQKIKQAEPIDVGSNEMPISNELMPKFIEQQAKMNKFNADWWKIMNLVYKKTIEMIENYAGKNFKQNIINLTLLALVAPNFDNDLEKLLMISNKTVEHLIDSDDTTRGMALSRIIEICALRQKLHKKAIYLPFKKPNILLKEDEKEGIKKKRTESEDSYKPKLFIDKANSNGLTGDPLYLRTYKSISTLSPIKYPDNLLIKLKSKEGINALFNRFLKEDVQNESQAEDKSNENLDETNSSSPWIEQLSKIFEPRYLYDNGIYNPIHSGFYQSIFQLYGNDLFEVYMNEVITPKYAEINTKSKNNAAVICAIMEIIAGYLRAIKVLDSEEQEKRTYENIDHCFEVMLSLLIKMPPDKIGDYLEAINYANYDRDPLRYKPQILKFVAKIIGQLEITTDKGTYFYILYRLVNLWGFRINEITLTILDAFIDKKLIDWDEAPSKFGNDFALCFGEILFSCCSCNLEVISGNPASLKCIHDSKCMKIVDSLKQLLEVKSKSNHSTVKQVLTYLLSESITRSKAKLLPHSWLFTELVPLIYKFAIEDDDKNVIEFALETGADLVSNVFNNISDYQQIVNIMLAMLKSENWRYRDVAIADLFVFMSGNWIYLAKNNENALILENNLIPLLHDEKIEIAKDTLTGISKTITFFPISFVQKISAEFMAKARQAQAEKLKNGAVYGPIFGLISIIDSFGAVLPQWLPPIITFLAKFKTSYSSVNEPIRECLNKFYETHKIVWSYEKAKFTEEQLAALSGYIHQLNYYS